MFPTVKPTGKYSTELPNYTMGKSKAGTLESKHNPLQ